MHSISDDGQVYSWGNDREKYGTLGLGLNYNQPTPLLNGGFANKKIIDISMSEKHCAAIDSNFILTLVSRQVYTWGTGRCGQLGSDVDASDVPIPVNPAKGTFVSKVQCGPNYTAFIDCNYFLTQIMGTALIMAELAKGINKKQLKVKLTLSTTFW
jgi:alpha-tubulin suppressor-like RCC1 family protein